MYVQVDSLGAYLIVHFWQDNSQVQYRIHHNVEQQLCAASMRAFLFMCILAPPVHTVTIHQEVLLQSGFPHLVRFTHQAAA